MKFVPVILVALSTALLFLLGLTTIDRTSAYHARLYFAPEKTSVSLEERFWVDVKAESEETAVNAVEAAVMFPADILQFTGADKKDSMLAFWIEEPSSPEDGVVRFSGGTPQGVMGRPLQVVRLNFKAVGIGVADVRVADAAVTAADGKGTNVLSTLETISIRVGAGNIVTPPQPQASQKEPESVPVIARPVSVSGHLPAKPKVSIPLYPDEERWYNHAGELYALWDVSSDITRVATAFDASPHTEPKIAEKELIASKSFGVPAEGVWYVHVQFKNNLGWGPVAHRRVAIDTTPPLPFEVSMRDAVTDIPNPAVQFHGHDELSGISHAVVAVDGKNPFTATGPTELPLQLPGIHVVSIRLFDNAGNSAEDSLEFEVLPLPTPSIDSFVGCLCQDEPFIVSGTAVPNVFVDLVISDKSGAALHRQSTESDALGNWKIAIDEVFLVGKYTFTVIARDERGARSLSTSPQSVTVRPRALLTIGSFQVGWSHVILMFLGLVALGRVVFVSYTSGWIKDIRKAGRR